LLHAATTVRATLAPRCSHQRARYEVELCDMNRVLSSE
jgi:hypothetical protein